MNFGMTSITPAAMMARLEDYLKAAELTLVPADCIFLSAATTQDNLVRPPASMFVTLFPARLPPWQSVYSGAGLTGFNATIIVKAFAKILNDQEDRFSSTFRDESYGSLALVGAICNHLQGWTAPLDAPNQDRSYLREPMRIIDPGPSYTPFKTGQATWSVCEIPFEMKFTALFQALTPPTP